MAIEKHFEDFNEDQFDFHAYCIRKVTLRSYVQLLRWENSLWGHDVYTSAAECIIKIYLSLFDNPPKIEVDNIEPDYSKMTAAERKKAKAQARKKKKKAEDRAKVTSKFLFGFSEPPFATCCASKSNPPALLHPGFGQAREATAPSVSYLRAQAAPGRHGA